MKPEIVPDFSQEYKLQARMQEAKILHNADVRADIKNVKVRAEGDVLPILYFCDCTVSVRSQKGGDYETLLPEEAALNLGAFEFPSEGTFDLCNVRIHPNGRNTITVDERSIVVQTFPDGKEVQVF